MLIAKKRKELENMVNTNPSIGTEEYNLLKIKDLVLDMESKFQENEIRSLFDYRNLMKKYSNNVSRIKVLNNNKLFELALNDCVLEAEENLNHRPLKEVLLEYLKEDTEDRNIEQVITIINNSGHKHLIDQFFA